MLPKNADKENEIEIDILMWGQKKACCASLLAVL